jgi:hypothetical protein
MEQEKGGDVEGFTLSGEEVALLSDKKFTIVKLPFYTDMKSLDNPTLMKRKLVIPIKLANGTEVEWIANKTSQKSIIAKAGRELGGWIGFKGEFVVKNQVVGKEEKKVIYLK